MTKAIINKRVSALALELKLAALDGLIVTSTPNVRYITGFGGHDSWAFVLGKRVWLITDSRYTEQAQTECPACKIIERKGTLAEEISKIVKRNRSVKAVGVEDTAALAVFANIKKTIKLKFKQTSNLIEVLRAIKTADEVSQIKKASNIADAAFRQVVSKMRIGMTESEFAATLDYQMRSRGATAGFETIVCFGPNGSRNHHVPGNRKLRKNDTVLVDFGASFNGYKSDKTRSFAIGKATRAFAAAYDTVARAQAAAIAAIATGVAAKDVDAAARKIIAETNFPVFGHGTGHGLGLEVHELPNVSGASSGRLKAGQVITVEPGIYIPGKFGIRIEDDILVTETGCKIISRTKQQPELKVIAL